MLLNLSYASPWLFASTFPHRGGSPLTLVSPTSAPLALAASLFPTLHQSYTLTLLLRNAWWRCVMPNEFLVTSSHSGGRSFWKNYSDICMCHGYKAPGSYPPTSLGFPCQPTPHLYCPSSWHLRQSFLKLLNMANCVRREAHFI